jgi:hypothetical protein
MSALEFSVTLDPEQWVRGGGIDLQASSCP